MNIDLENLTIKKAHDHLAQGDFSAVELAESYLKAIEEKDGEINAYLEVYDDALEQAKNADADIKAGDHDALTGIPIALKDNILIKGKTASAASKILENYRATYDSTVVSKMKEHNPVFLGRVNMDEFAMGASTEQSAFGVTKNPIDTTRVPGGSSGGSAAAVAGGMALGAFGSDTAGSIRQPASLCGVVGFKPTYGNVSRHGLIALGSSLDVIGPITKTVEDAEILFNAIGGHDRMDSTTVTPGAYPDAKKEVQTIGVPRHLFDDYKLDPRVRENFDQALQRLEELGYTIKDIELPNVKYAVPAYYIILPAEASSNLARFDGVKYGLHTDGEGGLITDYFASRGAGFGPEPRRRIMLGTYVLSSGYLDAYYNRATAVRGLIKQDYEAAFADVDVVATPTTAGPAFKIGEKVADPVQMYLEDMFTVPANHTGMPAISVPSGTVEEDGKDLPLGLHFIAPHMSESLLFEVGKKFLGEE